MTDIIAKPFDWNDYLSKEALEDFEGIKKDLPYCTCQSIGMALAKLELLEKQGCKVIDPFGSSSENPNKCEDAISKYQKIKQMLYEFKEMPLAPCLMKGHICAVYEILNEVIEPSVTPQESVAMMRNAIRNGTVLPKAYGRLIVLNDLYDFDRRKVEYAPTIIKAERGE